MIHLPDDPYLDDEAAFREEYGWCMDALRQMKLDEAIRLQAGDYVETKRIVVVR